VGVRLTEARQHRKKRKLMARLVYDLGIPAAIVAAIAGAAADFPAGSRPWSHFQHRLFPQPSP
jgi:hypothetical protein